MGLSILIIQTAFLGDVILSTAIAEKLHESLSDPKIDMLVRKGNESIFENHPFINELILWNKKHDKYKNLFSILKKIRAKNYDHVINLQRFGASGFLTTFSKGKETYGFNKNPFSIFFKHRIKHVVAKGVHETDRNQSLIKNLVAGAASRPRVYPLEKHYQSVSHFKTGEYITISPASVWYTKSFPNYKYIELTEYLSSRYNLKIYLLGAQNESEYCEYILTKSKAKNVFNLCGKLSILESAALMKDARMNYVNDSGPMHIASAVDAPVTAIYCSTIPEFGFGPLSTNSKIIQTHLNLDCKPCGLHGYKECPLIHFKCGRSIEVNEKFLP
jgi:lipopolysaccharide heptosyltransferase II